MYTAIVVSSNNLGPCANFMEPNVCTIGELVQTFGPIKICTGPQIVTADHYSCAHVNVPLPFECSSLLQRNFVVFLGQNI